jgi:hypothetical protein
MKRNLPPHPLPLLPKFKRQKSKARLGLPLAAWNFYSQKSLSPFLAWATYQKTHTHNCKEQPTYSLWLLIMLLLISELGMLIAIFLMQKERHSLAHQQFFLEHWTCPHRSNLFGTRNKCVTLDFTFQFIYKGCEFWAKPYGIKPRCNWEHLCERIWEPHGNMMGRH